MRNRIAHILAAAITLFCALPGCTHALAESQTHSDYGLGRQADPAQTNREDIDVSPDGSGLPAGRGDAVDGAALFATSCRQCHGTAIRLDARRWPYATTLFDYIRRAMPPSRTKNLSADDVYALTAYELNMNGLIEAHELVDRTSLPRVHMPGVENFVLQR